MSLDFLIPPIFLIAFVFLPLRLFLLPFALSGAGWFFWGCLVLLMPTHLRSRSGRSCGSFPASCYFSLYEIFKNLMLPSGKFFWKNIAISPNFVYTGRCIGHPSLRRKQVSSPPVQPHPAASRRGRQNCLPRLFLLFFLFCRYSYFQRCHCSVFSLSRLCYRSGTCAFGTAAEPAFALLRLL